MYYQTNVKNVFMLRWHGETTSAEIEEIQNIADRLHKIHGKLICIAILTENTVIPTGPARETMMKNMPKLLQLSHSVHNVVDKRNFQKGFHIARLISYVTGLMLAAVEGRNRVYSNNSLEDALRVCPAELPDTIQNIVASAKRANVITY